MGLRTTVVLIALCLVCAGCGGFKGIKRTSEDIVWSQELELDAGSELGSVEQRMARIVYPVDTRLQDLIQAFRTLERENGEGAGFAGLLSEFPWVASVAEVGLEGEVRSRQPDKEGALPGLEEVVREAGQWKDRKLHALYGKERFGRDVILVRAVYSGGEHTSYRVAAFDFSSLMQPSSRKEELVAVSQGSVLWAGEYDRASRGLAQEEWDQRLESHAYGRCRIGDRDFLWMARYIGQEPFFYATEIQRED
jgi:hypothetical protein